MSEREKCQTQLQVLGAPAGDVTGETLRISHFPPKALRHRRLREARPVIQNDESPPDDGVSELTREAVVRQEHLARLSIETGAEGERHLIAELDDLLPRPRGAALKVLLRLSKTLAFRSPVPPSTQSCCPTAGRSGAMSHVAHGHIEHILPKSERPELVVDWANLTLACPVCNTHKGKYYDPTGPLLNPYEDDPSSEIEFVGPMIRTQGTGAGYRAVTRLRLNRDELVLDRLRVLQQVKDLFRHSQTLAHDDGAREFTLDEMQALGEPGNEYSSAVIAYLELLGVSSSWPQLHLMPS